METREFSFGVSQNGSLVRTSDNTPLDEMRQDGWVPLSFTYHGGGYRVIMERGYAQIGDK